MVSIVIARGTDGSLVVERTAKSYCRICHGFCGTVLTVINDRITKVRGDKEDPASRGFACFKGLQAPEQHYGERRLLHSLIGQSDGFVRAGSEEALADAGAKLAAIVSEHGPKSVGFFMATQSIFNTLSRTMIRAFAAALDTPRLFYTMTIDQSAKWVAEGRLGAWDAGSQRFADADVWMLIGSNPAVTLVTAGGPNLTIFQDPVKNLKDARARGMKLIVVDPRRTETAAFADLFLQSRPGTDPEFAASLLHVILREGWYDEEFCRDYVDGMPALRDAVAPFAPEICAEIIGVAASDIVLAAEMFARNAHKGMVGTGTGPSMARYSNLAEHLFGAINVVCGRYPRAGERIHNPGVLQPERIMRAEVRSLIREWETGPKSYKHGLGLMRGTMMTAELVNEILEPGPGRMRALICVGGNPAVALPDQRKAMEALAALDLLIVIDPRLTETAKLASHVIAPKLHYERPDHTGSPNEAGFQQPYAHATPAIVPPPVGSDVVDEWYVLWSLARSLNLQLKIGANPIPMDAPPTTDELLMQVASGSRIPLDALWKSSGGMVYPSESMVQPRSNEVRFELLPTDVAEELTALSRDMVSGTHDPRSASFQLTVRRHREMMNSTGSDFSATWARMPGNPAFLHPEDMRALGLKAEEVVELCRNDVRIAARVLPDGALRRGVVSISHCWPGLADRPWEATNRLVDADNDIQSINHMPVMTGMWVTIERLVP